MFQYSLTNLNTTLDCVAIPVVPTADSEMLSGTVQEQTAVVECRSLVVVQQASLPYFPRSCVLQLGDGSVQQCDGCA